MIKFYKDDYAELTGMGPNAICFATDRKVILLDGHEYGKDQFKAVASSALATTSAAVAVDTVIFDKDNGILYQKTAADTLTQIQNVGSAVDELEAKLSTAYANGKVVLGNAGIGITSSVFVPDTTSGDLPLTGDTLSTILVNAATLKAQVDDINSKKATVTGGSGIAVASGTAADGGIEWTVNADVLTGSNISSSLRIDENGKLVDDLKIAKINTTTGYAASYALQTGAGVQLGETINIVKDQFLSSATLVYGTEDGSGNVTEVAAADATAATNRYLKLVFDVNTDGTVNTEAQSVVYINVNELFDSYTSGDGITVDNSANTIAVKVDTATEKDGNDAAYLTVGSNGLKVSGINAAISTAIQGLSTTVVDGDKYVTAVGVKADGTLSAATATISAGQVAFDPSAISSLEATTVQGAIAELASDVAGGFSSLSAAEVGGTGKYIQAISEKDGIISATAADLAASAVAYTNASAAGVADVSGALDDIYSTIGDLDAATSGVVGTPATGTPYTIINQVGQTDGKISATVVDMTAANTYQAGVTAVATGTSDAVRVGITSGTQASANDQFSNLIADYCSFHDKDGNVI